VRALEGGRSRHGWFICRQRSGGTKRRPSRRERRREIASNCLHWNAFLAQTRVSQVRRAARWLSRRQRRHG